MIRRTRATIALLALVAAAGCGGSAHERAATASAPAASPDREATLAKAHGGELVYLSRNVETGIPEDVTRAINLDYLDPAEVEPDAWGADPDTLVVPDAGEDLYRLR